MVERMVVSFRTALRSGVERGSVILTTMVLTFVLTLLGIALYGLAELDARLTLGNEADYRALELAQSAIERALYQLFLDMCGGSVACTSPPFNAEWTDGSINGAVYTRSTSTFQNVSGWGTPGSPLTSFGDPSGFGGVSTSQSYYVQLMNIVGSEAPTLGITCDVSPIWLQCKDAIRVRATATFTAGALSSTQILEVVAKATFNSLGGNGILAGAPSSGTISGNSELHGSLHMVGCPSGTCAQLSFTGNTGIFNNYNGLALALQNQVPRVKTIVCPPSTACAGTTVETLDAIVRVAKPFNNTLSLGGSAEVGETGSGTVNSVTGIVGKPTVDGVYLGDGCQTATCSDQVDNPNKVHSDKPVRGYDIVPPPTLPTLSDPVTILNLPYANYAACSGPGNCNSSGSAIGGVGSDFFISHAVKITASTCTGCLIADDTQYSCGSGVTCTTIPAQSLLNLLSKQGGLVWDDNTSNFSFTFTCGVGNVACDDANGNRVNGHVCTSGGTAPLPRPMVTRWSGARGRETCQSTGARRVSPSAAAFRRLRLLPAAATSTRTPIPGAIG